MTTSGRVLAIYGPDACLFSDDETACRLRDETPSMVMSVAGLCFISPKGNPADTLVCFKFNDAGLNRAIEDSEAIQHSLACSVGRLIRNIFDDY